MTVLSECAIICSLKIDFNIEYEKDWAKHGALRNTKLHFLAVLLTALPIFTCYILPKINIQNKIKKIKFKSIRLYLKVEQPSKYFIESL